MNTVVNKLFYSTWNEGECNRKHWEEFLSRLEALGEYDYTFTDSRKILQEMKYSDSEIKELCNWFIGNGLHCDMQLCRGRRRILSARFNDKKLELFGKESLTTIESLLGRFREEGKEGCRLFVSFLQGILCASPEAIITIWMILMTLKDGYSVQERILGLMVFFEKRDFISEIPNEVLWKEQSLRLLPSILEIARKCGVV